MVGLSKNAVLGADERVGVGQRAEEFLDRLLLPPLVVDVDLLEIEVVVIDAAQVAQQVHFGLVTESAEPDGQLFAIGLWLCALLCVWHVWFLPRRTISSAG